MKIKNLHLSYLRNNDHFQFHTGFKELIELFTASMLKIETLFSDFLRSFKLENDMLEEISTGNITDDLVEADNNRDITLSAMMDVIKSATKHFRPEVRQSAIHLQSLFDFYGAMSINTYDDQTAAINKLVEELVGQYASDVAVAGLSEWVSELKIKNLVFDSLKKNRYSEMASHTQLLMKHIRSEVDSAYYAIINRINAFIELEGEADYLHFVVEMNTRIDACNEIMAQHKSRIKKQSQITSPPNDPNNPRNSKEMQI